MKNTQQHEFPKENINENARDKEEKIVFNKSLLEEKDPNRVFGKDLKNSKGNMVNVPLMTGLPNQKINDNQKQKGRNEKEANIWAEVKKRSTNSDGVTEELQVMAGPVNGINSEQKERKMLQGLVLANDNMLVNNQLQVNNNNSNYINSSIYRSFSGEKIVRVGNYYVRQGSLNSSQNNNLSQSFLGESFSQKNPNDSYSVAIKKGVVPFMDSCDREKLNDPQYAVDYVREIFNNLKETEYINAPVFGYLSNLQDDINDKMRAVLIDWVIEVHLKFKLYPETLYMTVNLIDRYLGVQKIHRSRLQLLAVSAMLVASKYEEIYAPEVRDFVYITDKSYSKEEIVQMEYQILSSLNFDILQVSAYTFLRRFHIVTQDAMKSFYLAQFIIEFSLLEYRMLNYSSSMKAAAALFVSRKLLKTDQPWPQCLINSSGYSDTELKPCVKDLLKILQLLPDIKLKSCIQKFSLPKFMEVANIKMFN